MVGMAGFEPTTTTPPVWCATRLRYIPKYHIYNGVFFANFLYNLTSFAKRPMNLFLSSSGT